MSTLLCFGFGYCAEHFVAECGYKFDRVVGTVRGADRAATLNARFGERLNVISFDGKSATSELRASIDEANAVLVSISQDNEGDPVLRACGGDLWRAPRLRSVIYLSTIGIYGDFGGDWVDEATPPRPQSTRGRQRLAAEQAWRDFGKSRGIPVAVLRLAGIYGPGRNALTQVTRGDVRRIVKPGQVFNRIHVGDIAQAIDAALAQKASGIFNLADNEPSPPGEPITYAAQLLGLPVPPEISFADATLTMSPLALSFWQECRRVRNDKLKRELRVTLRYPTYREGLKALHEKRAD